MSRPVRSRAVFLGTCLVMLILDLTFDSHMSHAGEIYGRVAREGKVFPNAQVTIKCPSFSDKKTTKTDKNGKYRFRSGPKGEEKCTVSVNNLKNTVTIYTSKRGRTRANLKVIKGRLYKR